MSVLKDYIKWRGDLKFDMIPFNEADAMLFSEMAYFPWEYIPEKCYESSRLEDLVRYLDWSKHYFDFRDYQKEIADLAACSPRFADVVVSDPVGETDHEHSTQFAAVTFSFENKKHFMAFRGTDSSIAGWRENMDLAYEDNVPAQKRSVEYLKNAAASLKGRLYTGGHSKGGNLAVYSAVFAPQAVNRRIVAVYNFDGPGFNEVLASNERFSKSNDRIHTFVPQDSLIGMLLIHQEGYTVIHSYEKGGIKQHLMDSWEVNRDGLVRKGGLSRSGEFSSSNIEEWISKMTFEEKKTFVNVVFSLAEKNNIRSVDELLDVRNLVSVMNEFRKLDKNDKSAISSTLSTLGNTLFGNLKERYVDPISHTAAKATENITGMATLYLNQLEDKK